MFCVDGEDIGAHRFSYQLANGPIPEGAHILHRCDNPPCVNPSHLYAGSHLDNMRDRHARGRYDSFPGESNPNHCLTEDDVVRMRALYASGNCPQRELARLFHISQTQVGRVVRHESWEHVA